MGHDEKGKDAREIRRAFLKEVEEVFRRSHIYRFTRPYEDAGRIATYRPVPFFPSDYHRGDYALHLDAPESYEEIKRGDAPGRGVVPSHLPSWYLHNALDFTYIAMSLLRHRDELGLDERQTELLKRFVVEMYRDLPGNLFLSYMALRAVEDFEESLEKRKGAPFWKRLLRRGQEEEHEAPDASLEKLLSETFPSEGIEEAREKLKRWGYDPGDDGGLEAKPKRER